MIPQINYPAIQRARDWSRQIAIAGAVSTLVSILTAFVVPRVASSYEPHLLFAVVSAILGLMLPPFRSRIVKVDAGLVFVFCFFEPIGQVLLHQEAPPHYVTDRDLPSGKAWTPAGQPTLLFTQTPLVTNNTDITMGAYSMYIVREKDEWILVVNKDVGTGDKYDNNLDVVRMSRLMGAAQRTKEGVHGFVRPHPRQCNVRIYYGKSGTWAEFKEK